MVKKYLNVEYALTAPKGALEIMMSFGRSVVSQSVEVFWPQDAQRFVAQLRQEEPLNDAAVGKRAIEVGRQLDTPELEFIGAATLAKTLLRAETDPATPRHVREQVADILAESGVDPELVPLLDDEEAILVRDIMHRYDKVKPLFPKR